MDVCSQLGVKVKRWVWSAKYAEWVCSGELNQVTDNTHTD